MMKAFISYSSKDNETAQEVLQALENNDMECFYAPRDIPTGHFYAEEIILNLEDSDVLVLILSNNSNNSQHVLREVERAVSTNIPIIVYRIEEVKLSSAMEYFLMTNQWLTKSGEEGLKKLAVAVAEAGNRQSAHVRTKSGRKGKDRFERKHIFTIAAIVCSVMLLYFAIVLLVYLNSSNKPANPSAEIASSSEQESIEEIVRKEIHIGDAVTIGSYLSKEISWRVVDIDESGACTLIASQILCMKGFEGAQSGRVYYNMAGETATYDKQFDAIESMEALGSSDWEKSSLRAWLNSSNENVAYIGMTPIARVFCDGDNPYNTEAGFLHGFTAEEREAILLTELVILYHDPSTDTLTEKTTKDYVYIPSQEDVKLLEKADVSIYVAPTEEAIAADSSNLYKIYCSYDFGDKMEWWLRDPLTDSYSELYCVSMGYYEEMYTSHVAAVGGMGVRPMMRVSLDYLSTH